jgi:hypothetical protein
VPRLPRHPPDLRRPHPGCSRPIPAIRASASALIRCCARGRPRRPPPARPALPRHYGAATCAPSAAPPRTGGLPPRSSPRPPAPPYRCSSVLSPARPRPHTRLPSPRPPMEPRRSDQRGRKPVPERVSSLRASYRCAATGTASAYCRPGTRTEMSSIYRTRTCQAKVSWPRNGPPTAPEMPEFASATWSPLRNRTVDLLLTMHAYLVRWRRAKSDYRRSKDGAEEWVSKASLERKH